MSAATMPKMDHRERDETIRRDYEKLRDFGMSQLRAAIALGVRFGIDESRIRQIAQPRKKAVTR